MMRHKIGPQIRSEISKKGVITMEPPYHAQVLMYSPPLPGTQVHFYQGHACYITRPNQRVYICVIFEAP